MKITMPNTNTDANTVMRNDPALLKNDAILCPAFYFICSAAPYGPYNSPARRRPFF